MSSFENSELRRVGELVKGFKHAMAPREEEGRYVKSRLRIVCWWNVGD